MRVGDSIAAIFQLVERLIYENIPYLRCPKIRHFEYMTRRLGGCLDCTRSFELVSDFCACERARLTRKIPERFVGLIDRRRLRKGKEPATSKSCAARTSRRGLSERTCKTAAMALRAGRLQPGGGVFHPITPSGEFKAKADESTRSPMKTSNQAPKSGTCRQR